MSVFCFPVGATQPQIRDFFLLRENPAAQMSRHRRRAAALIGWKTLAREPGETWPEFWAKVQEDRG